MNQDRIKRHIDMLTKLRANLSIVRGDGKQASIKEAAYGLGDANFCAWLKSNLQCGDAEISWLHLNCPEYAAIKTPWDDTTFHLVQQWRLRIIDALIEQETALL